MVDPGTAMLIGQGIQAGGGILSALMGRNSQNDALSYNYAALAANRQAEDRAQFMRDVLSNRLMDVAMSGQTNARGDKVEYVPGVGWVTRPSDMTRSLMGASDAEELARLTQDASIRRRGLVENQDRRQMEGRNADEFMRRLMEGPQQSRRDLRSMLIERGTSGVSEGFDAAQDRLMKQALRSGTSAGPILAALASKRGEAQGKASKDAELQSYDLYDQLEGTRQSRAGNIYNTLATRASNFDDTPFAPNQINNTLASTASAARNTVPQTGGIAMGAIGTGGLYSQINPNYSDALATGSIADAAGGFFDMYGKQKQFDSFLQAMTNRNR